VKNRDAQVAAGAGILALALSLSGARVLAQDASPVALEELVAAAHENHADLEAARAAVSVARSQADEARARLLPTFTALGIYTRNEIEVVFRTQTPDGGMVSRTITPYDQLDARFALSVPIVDASSWAGFLSAEATGDAVSERARVAEDDVDVAVTQLYYQLVGARALVGVAERSHAVTSQALAFTRARHEVGVAPAAELARAEAEVLRAEQAREEAALAVTLAERNLANLTGLDLRGRSLPEIAVEERAPGGSLEERLARLEETPGVRAALAEVLAAERGVHAGWLAFVPTISGTAAERVTNAVGFGPGSNWNVALTASWSLDFLRPAQLGTREASLSAARARLERARQQARLQIEDAWHRSHALAARARTAAAVLDASRRAAEDARARYEVGVASQLELVQAERDLFAAEVSRVQALADLAVARATLAIRAR
jgi:outer membrane protein TolC